MTYDGLHRSEHPSGWELPQGLVEELARVDLQSRRMDRDTAMGNAGLIMGGGQGKR